MFANRRGRCASARGYNRHWFLGGGDGRTWRRHEVEVSARLSALGCLPAGVILEKTLRKMFDDRHDITKRLVNCIKFVNGRVGGTNSFREIEKLPSALALLAIKRAGLGRGQSVWFLRVCPRG
jgi:hypothetical protein